MKNKNNTPSIFIILGATGDLSSRKIMPSLWHLFRHGLLPDKLSVMGFSRRKISDDDFRAFIRNAVEKRGGASASEKDLAQFLSYFTYHAGDFHDESAFSGLEKRITETESSWGICANKLFYLAVPPVSYGPIFKNLAAVKLNLPCGGDLGWSRILVEKPFGTDMKTSRELQALLSAYFKEEQIYRIDHYLAKEIIQGIENFRFSNNLFEKTWDNTSIERIDIRLLETIGAEARGSFYDPIGAFRDVGQNHLLMMLAAITMEYSPDMKADIVRKSRVKVLKSLKEWTDETIKNETFRAQYTGYKNIEGVKPGSKTETYFSLKTELMSPRWSGVPIFLEAGKRAGKEARKEIVLTLKHSANCLLCEESAHTPNKIVFRLEPNDEIVIHFWMKKPGFERELEERTFSFFLYEKETKVQYVEEYGKLLYSAMAGNQALFVSNEEVEALWKFTDSVEDGWKRGLVPLSEYEPDTAPKSPLFTEGGKCSCEAGNFQPMAIGMVGLGKMGANLSRRLSEKGWHVIGYDRSEENVKSLVSEDIIEGADSLANLAKRLPMKKIVWLMVPSFAQATEGKPSVVDEIIFGRGGLAEILSKGSIIIDGGNSFYKDSVERSKKLKKLGISFFDVGVSGGPGGARVGPSLMIGGDEKTFREIEPLFRDLALLDGYQFFKGAGAGHFVKMVHNGIEYGMMQSLAEGFDVLKHSDYKLDVAKVAKVYEHGTVIESRLTGWLLSAFLEHGVELEGVSGTAASSGEGAWTVETAKEMGIPVRIIEESLEFRKQSEENPSYAGKIISALRNQFGGHKA
jgi:glucose-6-phosphate 1-dehydrogenase